MWPSPTKAVPAGLNGRVAEVNQAGRWMQLYAILQKQTSPALFQPRPAAGLAPGRDGDAAETARG